MTINEKVFDLSIGNFVVYHEILQKRKYRYHGIKFGVIEEVLEDKIKLIRHFPKLDHVIINKTQILSSEKV